MTQSTVATAPTERALGALADAGPRRIQTGIANAAIPFGRVVAWDTANGDRLLKLPAASGDVTSLAAGVAYVARMEEYESGGYADGDDVNVVQVGRVYVNAEEAVAKGAPVYVRYAAGTGTLLGEVRNDADTATCALLPGARFGETISAPGPVMIEINLP